MGQQFQMFKALEKEIDKIKGQDLPSHVFVMMGNDNKVVRAMASTTIRGRVNNHESVRILTIEELEKLMPKIEDGSITYYEILDDIVAEATKGEKEND